MLPILVCLGLTSYFAFAEKADVTNVVELRSDAVIQAVAEDLHIAGEYLAVSFYSKEKSGGSKSSIEKLVFLVGDDNTNSIEQLSNAYKGQIKQYEKTGIPQVLYSNEYSIYNQKSGVEIVRISLNPVGGWGYDTSMGMTYESYMLLGYFHEKVQGLMRLGRKRTKRKYASSYKKIYGVKPGKAPFTKLEDGLWCYSYIVRPNSFSKEGRSLMGVGVSYFEKYAKSLQIKVFKDPESGIESPVELQSVYDSEVKSVHSFIEKLTRKINEGAKLKGIYPDEKCLKALSLRRKKHFADDGINEYIAAIEKERINNNLKKTSKKLPPKINSSYTESKDYNKNKVACDKQPQEKTTTKGS